jgi:sugar O-acyltransferase (sialic acid O-acetyltransferase NeuD family)
MGIIIIGAGGHAKVVVDIIEKQGLHHILGFIDRDKARGIDVYGYPVLGGMEILGQAEFAAINAGIVAIGDNWDRKQVVDEVLRLRPEFVFVNALHPSAIIARGVEIGCGTVHMAGSIINSGAHIGNHCILNTNSSVDHFVGLGNFGSIGPGAVVGGDVTIGDYSVISLGANVIHNVHIGEHTVIGAGAVVVRSIDSGAVAYGVPAKVIRVREIGEKYL